MSVVQFKADKGCFPLIKILHAERNLSLFVSFQAEKKAMKNSVPQNFKKQLIWQSIDLALKRSHVSLPQTSGVVRK